MKIKRLLSGALLIIGLVTVNELTAGTVVPASTKPVFIDSNSTVKAPDNKSGSMTFTVINQGQLTSAVSEYSWLKVTVADNKLKLDYEANPNAGQRSARVYFSRSGANNSTMTFYQPGSTMCEDMVAQDPTNGYVTPSSATASVTQSGYGIELSYDNNIATFYHSPNSGFKDTDETTWPILDYFFNKSFNIGSITYVPRQNYSHGNPGVVEIYTRCDGSEEYNLIKVHDFGKLNVTATVELSGDHCANVNSVRFRVRSGSGVNKNLIQCAEMKFKKRDYSSDVKIFADDVCSKLVDGVTLTDIAKVENPILNGIAKGLYTGSYSSEGRVSTLDPVLNPSEHANLFKSRAYSYYQGATGIMLGKGTNILIVSGIPASKGSLGVIVRSWLPTNDQSENYTITNGINIINKTSDWNGLLYISNYYSQSDIDADNAAKVTVHAVNAAVNGVLSSKLTNEQNQKILDNACHGVIDLMGSHVQAIWQTESVKKYAVGQYVRYINIIDQQIIWIQRMMGMEKYGLKKSNVSLIFTCNYNYMTQTGTGIAMNMSQESRLINPDNILYKDDDVVWGMAHEWGHQHQMDPYLRWPTTWEVTNNLNACYNSLRMGYVPSRIDAGRKTGITTLVNDTHNKVVSSIRTSAINMAKTGTDFDWSPSLKAWAAAQSDTIRAYAKDKDRALSVIEADIASYLEMFFMVQAYFGEKVSSDYRPVADYKPDFAPDFYQSIRMTDYTDGSNIEKSTGVDKYELLASIQNGGNAKFATLQASYPESCWVKNGYITGSGNSQKRNVVPFVLNYIRKASRISGYNLVPYFERWGLLRSVAMTCGDYTSSYYLMPQDMLDEFRTDMEALNLKPVDEEMILRISNTPVPSYAKPEFPNDHAITVDEIKDN
jgi:hypothetical protein